MKEGLALSALVTEVERQLAAKEDAVVQSRALRLESNESGSRLTFGDYSPAVRDHPHTQIATHLKIDGDYYRRMRSSAPELLDHNVNWWLDRRPSDERRLVRMLDGGARAFLSDGYRCLDNYDLMRHILPELSDHPDLRFGSAQITERRLYLKVHSARLERDIAKVGDTVQFGLCVSNSEVGSGSLLVQPFSFTLSCLNGATYQEFGQRRNHVGARITEGEEQFSIYQDDTRKAIDEAFFLKVRDSVRYALSDELVDRLAGRMKEAAGIQMEVDPEKAVQVLAKRFDLSDEERGGTLRNLINGGNLSLWGLSGAVTATASTVESYDRASELEALGGRLALLPAEGEGALKGILLR